MDKHQIFPAFVSTADAATLLGISENSVRNFVRRGLLPTPKHLGTLDLQRVRLLQIGVAAINGSEAAGRIFDRKWWPLLEQQAKEMAELQKRMNPMRKPPRRKPPEAV